MIEKPPLDLQPSLCYDKRPAERLLAQPVRCDRRWRRERKEHSAMSMPRPDEATRAYFHTILPEDARIGVRPMFGNLAGFVNGNMFTGIFGASVFVRLPAEERAALLALPGA